MDRKTKAGDSVKDILDDIEADEERGPRTLYLTRAIYEKFVKIAERRKTTPSKIVDKFIKAVVAEDETAKEAIKKK